MNTDQKLLKRFIQNHTGDVLQIIEKLDNEEIAKLITILPSNEANLLLSQMDRNKAARCLQVVDIEIAIKLIEKLSPSMAVLILRQTDKHFHDSILDQLSLEHSKSIRQILAYPPDTVGAYLDPLAFTLQEDLSIGEGLEKIKEHHSNVLSHIFILSRIQLLVGFIQIKDLITNKKKKLIRAIMNPDPPKIHANINIRVLLEEQSWGESFSVLPVVNVQNIFLGIIAKETLSNINLKERSLDRQAKQASIELGTLYQIGFSSLFRTASEIIWENKTK